MDVKRTLDVNSTQSAVIYYIKNSVSHEKCLGCVDLMKQKCVAYLPVTSSSLHFAYRLFSGHATGNKHAFSENRYLWDL
jgi:hypothetical protein